MKHTLIPEGMKGIVTGKRMICIVDNHSAPVLGFNIKGKFDSFKGKKAKREMIGELSIGYLKKLIDMAQEQYGDTTFDEKLLLQIWVDKKRDSLLSVCNIKDFVIAPYLDHENKKIVEMMDIE